MSYGINEINPLCHIHQLITMKLSQLEKKGMFTLYRDEGEDQISQYLKNKQSSLQQTFTKEYTITPLSNLQPKDIYKVEKVEGQANKRMNKGDGISSLLEKNRVRRNHNLLKIFLKKNQHVPSNTEQLKNRLQQLLREQSTQKEVSKKRQESPQQLNTSAIKLNQSISIGRVKSKQKILLLNVPKRAAKHLKSIVYTKVIDDLKERDKLPNIQKVSASADLSLNISQKGQLYEDSKQRYLQPIIKSDRKYSKNHHLDLDAFHRKFSLERKRSIDDMSDKQKKLLQKFAESIKFK